MAQAPLQSPFFYYNPESEKARPQHFHQQQQQQAQYYQTQAMPQQNDYFSQPYTPSRPQSAHTAHHMFYQAPQYISQAMLTPATSPRSMQQRPTILVQQEMPYMSLDNECGDYRFGPATPTLSSSTSSISADSPQSAYPMLPTPGAEMYLSSFDGAKQGCDEHLFSEVLNGGEWSKADSPPMTPGKHTTYLFT